MTAGWSTQLSETLTIAWSEHSGGEMDRGTSALAHWHVAGILAESQADALRQAVRLRLDHQPVVGVVGRAAVVQALQQRVAGICAELGFELQALELRLEHGYSVQWQRG